MRRRYPNPRREVGSAYGVLGQPIGKQHAAIISHTENSVKMKFQPSCMALNHSCAEYLGTMARGRKRHIQREDRPRHFIREWREYRNLNQERLAERIGKSVATISQIENNRQGYTQKTLEDLAVALNTDPASLLMRNPLDPDGIWSIWDTLPPTERARAIEMLKLLARTG